MNPVSLGALIIGAANSGLTQAGIELARSVIKVAREPLLLAGVTLLLILSGITSLLLSGLVFRDWWQAFFLELGVGLLVVSIVEVAVLGVLHALTDGRILRRILEATTRIERELTNGSIITASGVTGETVPGAADASTPAPG